MTKFITASAEPVNPMAVLVTGFVSVFVVLLLLIGIIKRYSFIVSSVFSRMEKKKALKNSATAVASEETPVPIPSEDSGDSVDLQTIAVIAAAVTAYYGSDSKVRIHSVRRAKTQRSEWATAGINENIMARRGF